MRISDWSSYVCSSDLAHRGDGQRASGRLAVTGPDAAPVAESVGDRPPDVRLAVGHAAALEQQRIVVALGDRSELLGQARLADAGLAQHQQEAGPAANERGRASGGERVCEYVWISGGAGALK